MKNLFGPHTPSDLLDELLQTSFNENAVDKIFQQGLDINWQNDSHEGYLHLCAEKNLTQSMEWLIKNGADIELPAKENQTPLFYAVHAKAKDAIEVLINNNVNVDHLNAHGRTALQEAVISDTRNIIDLLITHSHSLNNVDEHGHNLIFDAVSNGNKDLISKVAKNKDVDINQIDKSGKTILHQSSVLKNSDIAIDLMDKGANPTIKDSEGKNFLFYAASNGIESESIIEKAISMGCNINSRNNDNQTILMETFLAFAKLSPQEIDRRASLLSMVRKLIKEGVEVDSEDNNNETVLFIAVRSKDMDSVLLLLEEDEIDINHQNINGDTVLDVAVFDGIENLDLILILLDSGANPNLKDKNDKTIVEKLIHAILYLHHNIKRDETVKDLNVEGKYMVVLKELLENSTINLNNLNSKGQPLFFDSVLYQNENLFKLLRSFGCDINKKDKEGKNIIHTLLEYAKKNEYKTKELKDILKNLIVLGVDVNSKDVDGNTAAHKAVLEHNEQILKIILDAQADMEAVDNKGRTIIHNCVWEGKLKHFRLIHSYNEELLNVADKFGILPINYAAFMGQKDLVLEMLRAGSHVNNNNKKDKNMIEHLSQFASNLKSLTSDIRDELDKMNVNILVETMMGEFFPLEEEEK